MNIVDIHGLAEILLCSDSMLNKTWAEYPHFFIGLGRTARGARFDVDDVLKYLKGRDYAYKRQENKIVDREYSTAGVSKTGKKRVSNKNSSKRLGALKVVKTNNTGTGDRFNLLAGIR